jgi:hypothetical protein
MHHTAELWHSEIQVFIQQLILPYPLYIPAGCSIVMDLEAICPQIQHRLHRPMAAAYYEPIYYLLYQL